MKIICSWSKILEKVVERFRKDSVKLQTNTSLCLIDDAARDASCACMTMSAAASSSRRPQLSQSMSECPARWHHKEAVPTTHKSDMFQIRWSHMTFEVQLANRLRAAVSALQSETAQKARADHP
jgi:hypothetical protein